MTRSAASTRDPSGRLAVRLRRPGSGYVALLALGVLCGCQPSGSQDAQPAGSDPAAQSARRPDSQVVDTLPADQRRIRSEFAAIARQLKEGNNEYLGHRQLADIEAELQTLPDGPDKVNKMLQQCWHQLRLGKIESAHETIAAAFDQVSQLGGEVSPSMLKLRALVNLRDAEQQNCIDRHNRECCVFPLRGGGIHSVQQPIRQAQTILLQMHERDPHNLEAAWLLNLASMARGDYPSGVPEYLRLPPALFAAEGTIGRFVDVAKPLGLDTLNLCGGALADDFDGDELIDVITTTYDPSGPMSHYRNQGKGAFSDVSIESGVASQLGGLNCVAADYDNDGDLDVLVLRGAWLRDDGKIRNSLLENDGKGRFTDVTHAAGLADPAYPTQAAVWGDFDGDGDLDLYVANESRVEFDSSGGDFPSQLFRNNGDGTFTDIARTAGVTNDRYAKGVTAGDYDNDGDLDIYVSNRGANRLYQNDGRGHFVDAAASAQVGEPSQQSFATWFFDYDNDGWLDLFVAAYQSTNADVAAGYFGLPHSGVSPCLYRNLGNGSFEEMAERLGLDRPLLPMGANFGDIDNDGYLDIYLTTGRPDFAALMPNVMFRNDEARRFQDVTFEGGFGHLQKGHGVAFADIDHDGDQDIYHQLGGFYPGDKFHNALFLNPGSENHFITIRLVGTTCNRQAVGARIRILTQTPTGPREFHRAAGIVSSFGGSTTRQEIGLGAATTIERIEILWPGSEEARQALTDVPLDCFVEVTQGVDGFRKLDLPVSPLDRFVNEQQQLSYNGLQPRALAAGSDGEDLK